MDQMEELHKPDERQERPPDTRDRDDSGQSDYYYDDSTNYEIYRDDSDEADEETLDS